MCFSSFYLLKIKNFDKDYNNILANLFKNILLAF